MTIDAFYFKNLNLYLDPYSDVYLSIYLSIYLEDLYSDPSRELLRGAPSPGPDKKNGP